MTITSKRKFTMSGIRPPSALPPDQMLKSEVMSAEIRPTKREGLHTLRLSLQVVGGAHAGKAATTFNLLDERGLTLLRRLLGLAGVVVTDDDDFDLGVLTGLKITASVLHDEGASRIGTLLTTEEA